MNKQSFFSTLICLALLFGCAEDGIEEVPLLDIQAEVTNVSSYNGTDGAITVNHTGGEPPYSYFWNTGATTKDLIGVPAGEYELNIVYGNSGFATRTVTITEPAPSPLAISASVQQESYFGAGDASIDVNIAGGAPPYTYLWEDGSNSEDREGLSAGMYTLTVTDASSPNPIVTTQQIEVAAVQFICGQDSVTDVDGNRYPSVDMGDAGCWTAENLRTQHRPDVPDEEIQGRFCQDDNCSTIFGAHYTWEAAMNGLESVSGEEEAQGICPTGWHIPTREEWQALNSWLSAPGNGGEGVNAPAKMRGTNSSSGFNGVYAGNFGYDVFTGELAVFWSATERENDESRAWYRLLNNFPLLGQGHEDKRNGLSIRCVQNK